MIIDAENLILGRLASFAAKRIQMHEKVDIINSEKAVVTGNKKEILAKYKQKKDRGAPLLGPYYPSKPDMLLRRTIRGMIPWRQARGHEVYKYIKCYKGIPDSFKGKQFETVPGAHVSKMKNLKYITLEEISKHLGVK